MDSISLNNTYSTIPLTGNTGLTPKPETAAPMGDTVSIGRDGSGIEKDMENTFPVSRGIPSNLVLADNSKNRSKFANMALKGLFTAASLAYLGGCAAFAAIPNYVNKKRFNAFSDEEIQNIKSQMKPGDIVLTQSKHHQTFYYFLKSTFGHKYSHAATYVGGDYIIDSYDKPDKQSIFDFFKRSTNIAVLRPKFENDKQVEQNIKYLEKQIGKDYDMKFDLTDDSQHYCSELTLRGLEASGLDAKVPGHSILGQPFVLPDNFFKGDKIELVGEFEAK